VAAPCLSSRPAEPRAQRCRELASVPAGPFPAGAGLPDTGHRPNVRGGRAQPVGSVPNSIKLRGAWARSRNRILPGLSSPTRAPSDRTQASAIEENPAKSTDKPIAPAPRLIEIRQSEHQKAAPPVLALRSSVANATSVVFVRHLAVTPSPVGLTGQKFKGPCWRPRAATNRRSRNELRQPQNTNRTQATAQRTQPNPPKNPTPSRSFRGGSRRRRPRPARSKARPVLGSKRTPRKARPPRMA